MAGLPIGRDVDALGPVQPKMIIPAEMVALEMLVDLEQRALGRQGAASMLPRKALFEPLADFPDKGVGLFNSSPDNPSKVAQKTKSIC